MKRHCSNMYVENSWLNVITQMFEHFPKIAAADAISF